MSADPDWWKLSIELEQQDRLAEAEQVIKAALAPRGDPWDYQTAYLYELRARRLVAAGKLSLARQAADRAHDLMWQYASGATSGGEGIALSAKANQTEKRLEELLRGQRTGA